MPSRGSILYVDMVGLGEIIQKFDEGSSQLNDVGKLLDAGRLAYSARVSAVFDTEGAAGEKIWDGLSESRIRERGDGGHPILDYEHDLRLASEMLYPSYVGDKVVGTYYLDEKSLFMKVEGDKVINNAGIEGRLPARPFWPWRTEDQDEFYRPLDQWAEDWCK